MTRRDSLFNDPYQIGFIEQGYDIARDGKSFLMVRAGNPEQRVIVVLGWFDELRERMARDAQMSTVAVLRGARRFNERVRDRPRRTSAGAPDR